MRKWGSSAEIFVISFQFFSLYLSLSFCLTFRAFFFPLIDGVKLYKLLRLECHARWNSIILTTWRWRVELKIIYVGFSLLYVCVSFFTYFLPYVISSSFSYLFHACLLSFLSYVCVYVCVCVCFSLSVCLCTSPVDWLNGKLSLSFSLGLHFNLYFLRREDLYFNVFTQLLHRWFLQFMNELSVYIVERAYISFLGCKHFFSVCIECVLNFATCISQLYERVCVCEAEYTHVSLFTYISRLLQYFHVCKGEESVRWCQVCLQDVRGCVCVNVSLCYVTEGASTSQRRWDTLMCFIVHTLTFLSSLSHSHNVIWLRPSVSRLTSMQFTTQPLNSWRRFECYSFLLS